MAGPPSYLDTSGNSQDSPPPPGHGPYTGPVAPEDGRDRVIVIAALALMLILHLTGTLGPGTHG